MQVWTPSKTLHRFLLPCLLVLLALLEIVAAAPTPPGTTIQNRATLTYQDAATGELIEVVSNVATVSVGEYFSFLLLSEHQAGVEPGAIHSFSHQLGNVGNVDDGYTFTASSPDNESSFDIVAVRHDLNGNGVADADEPLVGNPVRLAPGESIDVVVEVSVLRTALPGTSQTLNLSVASESGNQQTVSNTITVDTGAIFSLIKTAGPACHVPLFPGDSVTHEIEVTNAGSSPVSGQSLLLDGEKVNGVVVRQDIPELMRLTEFGAMAADSMAVPVVRLAGVADNSWVSAENIDELSQIVSAGLFIESGSFGPDSREVFSIVTTVQELDSEIKLVSSSAMLDVDGNRSTDFESNSTCHTFSVPGAATQAQLEFIEPAPAVRNRGGVADFNTTSDFVPAERYALANDLDTGYRTERDGFYLELELGDNLDSSSSIKYDRNGKRYIETIVESSLTGDQITVLLLETTATGLFRSVSPVKLSTHERSNGGFCPAIPDVATSLEPLFNDPSQSCVLASGSDDELLASYLDRGLGFAIAEAALVNPQAIVFNAQTGLPVAGATVSIIHTATGDPVVDSISGLPYEFVTGPNGLYVLPRLEPFNRYYIRVEPPQSHVFPSVVPADELPLFNVTGASYGASGIEGGSGDGSFAIESTSFGQPPDIPLDSSISDALLVVEKQALLSEADIGQIVTYSVAVKNRDERPLTAVTLYDRPPYGYRYVPVSATVDGEVIADPVIGSSGELRFELGALDAGEVFGVNYALRSTAAAIDSDGINEAVAQAVNADNSQVVSPPSRARVTLSRQGVLSDRAALFGKIFIDQNCDGMQNHREWPVGGVRVYLQDGTFAVSDADGLFSLYGLKPGSHVLKVDRYTLPDGLVLKPLDSNQAVDPNSRFIELTAGDFHRADFAANCPRENVDQLFAEIKARNEAINGSWLLKEVEQFRASEELPVVDPQNRVQSLDGDISSGVLHGPVREEDGSVSDTVPPAVIQQIAATQTPQDIALPDPKKLVAEITQQQAKAGTWIWPTDDLSVRGRFMAVVRDGIEPTLYVNDKPVPASQIGERLANRREKAQIIAWYGVELDGGENKVEVKGIGPFGNERVLATGVFKKPSSGASIKLTVESDTIAADAGRSTLPVRVQVLDEHGYPALGVYFVTLENSDGAWLEADIQESEPGRQVRVNNGERIVHYTSSGQTGEVLLRASTGKFSDEVKIQQVTEIRPLIASGLLEASVRGSSSSFGEFRPSSALPPFDGGTRVHARAAMFAKGRVKDKFNLTLSYDSDKSADEQLLRDINPGQHYPVHGDASVRGFDAQSRSKLYVKIEEDKNSLMWGDFLTDPDSDNEDLARSRRALTGFNSVIDHKAGHFRFFASRQEDNRLTEEVRGNGSAMLYRLESYPIVPNSDVVELVTRSRENPGLVIARTRLSRFGDYTIDPVYGFVTFSSVIPTVDDQQNQVFIQFAYDVEANGEKYWVTGMRFDRKLNDKLQLGASYTRDDDSRNGATLAGVYATYKAGNNTRVDVSVANSQAIDGDKGNAGRVSIDHRWSNDARTTFTYARAEPEFSNSGAAVASGRMEARLSHRQALKKNTTVVIDALKSDSLVNGEGRQTIGAQIESRLHQWLVRAGLRQVTQEEFARSEDFVTAVLGVNRQITIGDKSGQFNAELEQDTGRASRRRVKVGGKLQVHEKARVYSNYELSNSLLALSGVSNSQRTELLTMGVESDVLPSTRLYSEYRMRGAFDSRDYETASGIRADYDIEPDLRVSPSLEVVKSNDLTDSIAASVGVVDTRNPNSRRLLRLETRQTDVSDYVGLRASYAARINQDWTGVVTENLSRQDSVAGEETLRHSFVAGFSRRPKLDNRHHSLWMYNWKEEKGVTAGVRRSVHLLSTHQNLRLSNGALLSGRLGGKHLKTRFSNTENSEFTVLADVRLNFDFNRRINVDLRGGMLATDGMSEMRYSAGAGLYYVINKNARIGFGYNFGGFRDEDLDTEEFHARGWHFGLQYKFDEDFLKWLE